MSMDWPVHWLPETDSTNLEAKRRAEHSGFANQWIAAHIQTAGRGRLGRDWISPQGNLYATALLHWQRPVTDMTRLPFATALAVIDTIDRLAPDAKPAALLKWPNDVRCAGAKISGILVETGDVSGTKWSAIGIGINTKFVPSGLDQAATCLADLRGDDFVTPDLVFETLRIAFASRLEETLSDFSLTREAWLARAEGLGQTIRVISNGVAIEGVFTDMAADGALLLHLPDGSEQLIRAGDVELIREVRPN